MRQRPRHKTDRRPLCHLLFRLLCRQRPRRLPLRRLPFRHRRPFRPRRLQAPRRQQPRRQQPRRQPRSRRPPSLRTSRRRPGQPQLMLRCSLPILSGRRAPHPHQQWRSATLTCRVRRIRQFSLCPSQRLLQRRRGLSRILRPRHHWSEAKPQIARPNWRPPRERKRKAGKPRRRQAWAMDQYSRCLVLQKVLKIHQVRPGNQSLCVRLLLRLLLRPRQRRRCLGQSRCRLSNPLGCYPKLMPLTPRDLPLPRRRKARFERSRPLCRRCRSNGRPRRRTRSAPVA